MGGDHRLKKPAIALKGEQKGKIKRQVKKDVKYCLNV
jgi:hypothetical protein